jgi:tetratricopeptide (TPR) repeat protein
MTVSRAERLEEAAEHLRKARFPKAIDCYRALLSEDPENPELRATLAEAYRRGKNPERAFHHFTKAAAIHQQRGDLSAAATLLETANGLSPNEPDILFRLSECQKALGRIDDLKANLITLVRAAHSAGDRRRLWALEELFALHPEDLSVAQQRAEALAEAGQIDAAVAAYKKLSALLSPQKPEFAQILMRAAQIAKDRPDLGADLAEVLRAHGRAREALMSIVSFYESFPDNVAVLESLVRTLEALRAEDKIVPARVELVKARAKLGAKAPLLQEVESLLARSGEDPSVLEVCAHAVALVREQQRAVELWRRLARVAEKRKLKAERDRAVGAILKANPDDQEALEIAATALKEQGLTSEAAALRKRLEDIRKLKQRAVVPAPREIPPAADTAPMAAPPKLPVPDQTPFDGGTVMVDDEDIEEFDSTFDPSQPQVILPPDRSDRAERAERHERAGETMRLTRPQKKKPQKDEPEVVSTALGKVSAEQANRIASVDTRILPSKLTASEEGTDTIAAMPTSPMIRRPNPEEESLPPWVASASEEEITSKLEAVMIDQLRPGTRLMDASESTILLPGELADIPFEATEPEKPLLSSLVQDLND